MAKMDRHICFFNSEFSQGPQIWFPKLLTCANIGSWTKLEGTMKAVGLSLALIAAGSWAAAQDIGGRYSVNGTNLDGSIYRGEAEITLTSEFTCEIVWKTGGTTSSGICMRDGNAFAAGYEMGGNVGLVIYMVQPDGTLDGSWTIAGVNAVGTEVLTPN